MDGSTVVRLFETDHLDGLGHADKKFHFRADWAALAPMARTAVGIP